MDSSEIWDKYHSVVLEMEIIHEAKPSEINPFKIQQECSLSQIFTAIFMLFHVNTILADFCWCSYIL